MHTMNFQITKDDVPPSRIFTTYTAKKDTPHTAIIQILKSRMCKTYSARVG